jgi:hypothetical protein
MTRLLLLLLLAAGFLVGVFAFAPIGKVLQLSGAEQHGFRWTGAEGSVMDGRLRGMSFQGKPYGDAGLKLAPGALLSGRIQYAVDWIGEHGQGAGNISFGSGQKLQLDDFNIDLDLLRLEQAARWIQQSGGRVQLTGGVIRFNGSQCAEATGTATSDVLDRNREILGDGWTDMTGDLHCDAGDLIIPLQSENGSGTRFLAQLRVAPGRPGRFEARVSGMIPRQLQFALPIAGFKPDGGDFVYAYASSIRNTLP